MAFKLDSVVPWGRNFEEYSMMFQLHETDRQLKIVSFGDGPASFNYEATAQGWSVTSFDPIYQFTAEQLQKRIEEVRLVVMEQMKENKENYIWTNIKSLEQLEEIRMSAMKMFLADFETGKSENRYIHHELPDKLQVQDNAFDVGLSSHFLLLYTELGYDFHIKAISEMLRVCKEVRIFPILDLDGKNTKMTEDIIEYFRRNNEVEIRKTKYEFQKGGNKLLIIRKQ